MLFDNINNCGERVGYGALLHGLPSQVAIAPFEMNGVFVDPRNGNANKAHGIPSSSGSGPATPVIATATVAGIGPTLLPPSQRRPHGKPRPCAAGEQRTPRAIWSCWPWY